MACHISRTPMPKRDSEILIRKFTYLEENVDASHLLSFLFERFIIDDEDMSRISNIENRTARNKQLLQTLLHRGDGAWSAFVAALRAKGYKEVATELFLPNNVNGSHTMPIVYPSSDDESECELAVYQKTSAHTPSSVRTPAHIELDDQINTVSDQNEYLKFTLKEKDQAIAEKDQTIVEKDQTIAEKDKIITEKSLIIAQKEDTIGKLNNEICSLKNKIERLQKDENRNTLEIIILKKEVATLQDEVNSRLKHLETFVDKGKSKVCILS